MVTVFGVEWTVNVTMPFGTVLPDKTSGLSEATEIGLEASLAVPSTLIELAVGAEGALAVVGAESEELSVWMYE